VAAPVAGARTVSLIEDDVEAGAMDVTAEGGVAVELSPFEVRTLRFTLDSVPDVAGAPTPELTVRGSTGRVPGGAA
jgi:hypothetical protein